MRPQPIISLVSLFLAAPAGLLCPTPYSLPSTHIALAQTSQERKAEADRLIRQGNDVANGRNYSTAIRYYQQALEIYQQLGDNGGQLTALSWLGRTYQSQGNFKKAIEPFQSGLVLARSIGDGYREAEMLRGFSSVYESQANFAKAVEYAQQSWRIAQKIKDPQGREFAQSDSLIRLVEVYSKLGDEAKANEYRAIAQRLEKQRLDQERQQLLQTHQQGNRKADIMAFASLASNYKLRGDYIKAASYYQQAVSVARAVSDRSEESWYLGELASLYLFDLNEPRQAINYYKQQLVIAQKDSDKSFALLGLAQSYSTLTLYNEATNYYQKILVQAKERGDRSYEAIALDGLASEYFSAGNYTKAAEYYQLKIIFAREGNAYLAWIEALSHLGEAYKATQSYSMAIGAYHQAFLLAQNKQDRRHEIKALKDIGDVFVQQKQSQLATIFYKQAVNIAETIRQDLQQLPKQQQEAYVRLVADAYRTLADLLIQQGRLPEAQAVLELLKLRELKDFTRDAGIDSPGINLAKVEDAALKQILQRYTTVGGLSQKIDVCEQSHCPEIKQLQDQRDQLNEAVKAELNQQRAVLAKYFSTESATLVPEKLNAEARRIVNAQPGTVLIYPLMLKDKIQFLLALKAGDGAVTFRPFETRVSAETLFKTIQTLREQLQSPGNLAALQATSQQLHTWLIKPLEPELNNPAIKHLVFAPDSTTRYIPLAALFDGKHYLVERYSLSTITAASKTDTRETFAQLPVNNTFLLAVGASTFANANPLENVPAELNAIVKPPNSRNPQGIYPGLELLNTQFNFDALKTNLKGHQILHIATHGKFQPGRPEDSYLLPGRGQKLTTALIDQLGDYGLGDIHLVVLSACETAVGDRASDGIEIPGISYFFLKNEVKSVMASLWSVNDASTSLMMQQFYKQLATGKTTKAEALQIVQQQFITGKLTAKDAPGRSPMLIPKGIPQTHRSASGDFSHPYYWAPFILIGNSL